MLSKTVPQRTLISSTDTTRRADVSPVDASRSRAVVALLRSSGLDLNQISQLSNTPVTVIRALRRGHCTHVTRLVDARLRAVVDQMAGEWVDGTGVARRLQALQAIGWSRQQLATHLHIPLSELERLLTGERCSALTRAHVCRLYDRIWDQPRTDQGGKHTCTLAAKAGYAVPMAWDDDTIDDPTAQPVIDTTGPTKLLDQVEWLLDQGETLFAIAARVRRQPGSIAKATQRHNRPDLWSRLAQTRTAA